MTTVRTPDQRLRVFVSSTLAELAPERAAVRTAVERMRLTAIMFEIGARPHPPRTLYRAYLEQSHVFVGVYWQRYGWVAPDQEISGLEDELRLSGDRPRLIYIKEPAPDREERLQSMLQELETEGRISYRRFAKPEELTELIADDLAHLLSERFESAEETGEQAMVRPTALPIPLTRLVGRDDDAESVWSLLEWDEVRLVTLTGVGGIGKSRLALELADRARRLDPDWVVFVDLAPIADPGLFPRSVAAALAIGQRPNQPLIETIQEELRSRRVLLVLDNFEQIAAAAGDLERILTACPNVKALVTSRIALGIAGEHRFPVPPLNTTGNGAGRASESAAVELFIERAQEVDPGFALTEENQAAVAELCGRLDGLPLAIELAAARVRLLRTADLLAHLEARLDLAAPETRPERQRTLRTTIDWSHELLDPTTQRLCARLAVFSGGWTLRAAEEVCGDGLGGDVLEALSSLLDKSLVSVDSRQRGEPRFRMLETVREYAAERLRMSGEGEDLRRRHAEYFGAFCAAATPQLYGSRQQEWLPRIDADLDNIRALVPWAIGGGDCQLAAGAIASIWPFHWIRGLAVELREAMDVLVPYLEDAPIGLRAQVALARGGPLFLTGELEAARACLAEAVELARRSGETRALSVSLTALGAATPVDTGYEEAETLVREGLEIARATNWPWGMAFAQVQLGALLLRDRRLAEGEQVFRGALEIAEELGDDGLRALAITPIGVAQLLREEFRPARETLARAVLVGKRSANRESLAYCLEAFAALLRGQRDPEPGAVLLGAAQTIREAIAIPVSPFYRPLIETLDAALREDLGDGFDELYAAGRRMSEEEALNLALRTSEESGGQSAEASASRNRSFSARVP